MKREVNFWGSPQTDFRFSRRGGQALLQGCTTPYRQTWPVHARRGQTLFFLSGQQKSYSSRLRRNSGGRGTQVETFVEDARALANAWTRQMEQNEPHTTGALHPPSLKADHLRTALRESDIPILIVVHDWALLLDAFQEKATISYLNNRITELCNSIITELCKL